MNHTSRQLDFKSTDKLFAFSGELGALWTPQRTEFRVWSPFAESVSVNLYERDSSPEPMRCLNMENNGGVWSTSVSGDLHGVYYTYNITVNNRTKETIDIYARSAGVNGIRGMVLNLRRTDPEGWENTKPVTLESYTDAVIAELHVRDFSMDMGGNFKVRGKYAAFCEEKPTNKFGDVIGLDYLARLGITHIQIQPVFDFATSDESSSSPKYNWGYDPLNFNVPEGSYSADPSDGALRVRELKELVMAAHKRGLGVIMDVVYNHTYSTEDSPFTKTFPDYYYRQNADGSLSDGSACGNEFASERAMARKFIVDSVCYWADEYKLDGFRFDLMGLLDIETLELCAKQLKEINPSIILYGEGWTGGKSTLDESRRGVKKNASKLPDYAMFSDDFRDGVKGSVFIDDDCGFVNGNLCKKSTELIKSVMSAGVYRGDIDRQRSEIWTDSPCQTINYVEVHDNLTLYDKLRVSMPNNSEKEIVAADLLAAALIFLSQGIPLIQVGQEMLKSKVDPNGGYVHDSYKSPDSVNSIKWNDVFVNRMVVEYYRGLIAVRKSLSRLRLGTADEIRREMWFEDIFGGAFAAHIGNILILVNPLEQQIKYQISGKASVYISGGAASDKELFSSEGTLTVEPVSVTLALL